MKTVAFVPIKLHSERLKNKNILPLGDKNLCYYIFESLLKVEDIDEVYVFCSNPCISDYIPKEVKFQIRNKELDLDSTKGLEIYHSFANIIDADVYILAHATSPFIKSETIKNALDHVLNNENDSALSVQRMQTFSWYDGKPLNYELDDIPRTQDIKPVFVETSAFFIFKKDVLKKYNRRIGFNPFFQEVDNVEAIDIDEKKDYEFAKKIKTGEKR